ncbi:MAG: discoidin domain-containing protein [Gemmatimonadaceae bacterium]|nr:discoidin domain-containing protein [Gemmatimonadaceae bacterium]
MKAVIAVVAGVSLLVGVSAAPAQSSRRVLESFDAAAPYTALPSDGVRLSLSADSGVAGRALRMDYDFQGRAGYAVARRAFALPPLPAYWSITLWIRGSAKPNTLEIKLADSTGQNVWWMRRPELSVANGWTQLRFRPSDLSYAWGPLGGGPPRGIAALEIAFTAGQGGKGWIALDDMILTSLSPPVPDRVRPSVSASSSLLGRPPALVVPVDFAVAPRTPLLARDGSGWRSAGDGAQWLALDFGGPRSLGGLVLDWSTSDWPVDYDVETSDDGRTWTLARAVRGSGGGRRYIHLPGAEPRQVRLALKRSSRGTRYALGAFRILSDSVASTRSAFLERVAEGSAPGAWPRPLAGQQSYWTVVGLPRDEHDALFSEDGSVESRPGGFSIEPFLYADGRLLTWREGLTAHSLDGGFRPIPTARRVVGDLALATTAYASGRPGSAAIWVRYDVVNAGPRPREVRLFAAVRPVQVNPPWQFLGTAGGAASVRTLRATTRQLVVNDSDFVVAFTPATAVGVASFDSGSVVDAMRGGTVPRAVSVNDPAELAEAAFSWALSVRPRDSAQVWLMLPARGVRVGVPDLPDAGLAARTRSMATNRLAEARALWDRELGATEINLPETGAALARTLRTALAHVLINARGPAIQPGTRSYRRSWIRDCALTSSALMRMGHVDDARAFLDWFVPYVFPNGKVPCCVDHRGADPVTENDADGELLYLAAEYFRITGDSATVRRHWSTLARVAAHLDSLRNSRRTAEYRTPDSLLVFGLLPPSISHEGYSAKPAYSYWDDWWGVRGLDDAGQLARVVGDAGASARFAMAGREMRRDVVASIARSMALFGRRALPGAAELGDLDPTSSTMALEPAQALSDLPRAAVLATFDSAWATLERRRQPGSTWDIFTPYEWRDVGAYIRLGQPDRAHAYADWLMTMRRPAEWNQWSEAVWREPRTPKFIGDMPHGWVASDFMRATLDMLAYEREGDATLVVGAGIPIGWARSKSGVVVMGLRTWWGALNLNVQGVGSGANAAVRVTMSGVLPPGGIELRAPFGAMPHEVLVDGVRGTLIDDGRAVRLRGAATVEFRY